MSAKLKFGILILKALQFSKLLIMRILNLKSFNDDLLVKTFNDKVVTFDDENFLYQSKSSV